MLTPNQIAALRDRAFQITDPINDYLLEDIARRISEAGQLTSTAAYQVWQAQQLGVSQQEIRKRLQKLLRASQKEIKQLLTQSAEVGYSFDISRLPHTLAVPFQQNAVLQQIVNTAVELAQENFTNLTQALGLVDPYGNAQPLQAAYRACTDFAFKQVVTGAADYSTAIRQATRNLAAKGVQVIDYESGVHTSLEAAVRRNIMGGLGLMQEQISQANHDTLGCDGWEITAHANSAPDHEPIQGRQYSDAAYEALNNSLVRRIGTLNCGHAAFPIILGVNSPQYTPEELEKLRTDNKKGVTVDEKHYTGYEATQIQRKLERAIRSQKRRVLVDKAAGDGDKLRTDRIRLNRLNQEYERFFKAAKLKTQYERTEVAGFGSVRQAVTPVKTASTFGVDVTGEYLKLATPGQGEITYDEGYKTGGHRSEIRVATWLRDTFGGDIRLLSESAVKGDKRADYLWRGRLWELKGASSINGADKLLRHALKQIQNNPGGVIMDVPEAMDLAALEKQIMRRFQRGEVNAFDLMLLVKGELKKVLGYKK